MGFTKSRFLGLCALGCALTSAQAWTVTPLFQAESTPFWNPQWILPSGVFPSDEKNVVTAFPDRLNFVIDKDSQIEFWCKTLNQKMTKIYYSEYKIDTFADLIRKNTEIFDADLKWLKDNEPTQQESQSVVFETEKKIETLKNVIQFLEKIISDVSVDDKLREQYSKKKKEMEDEISFLISSQNYQLAKQTVEVFEKKKKLVFDGMLERTHLITETLTEYLKKMRAAYKNVFEYSNAVIGVEYFDIYSDFSDKSLPSLVQKWNPHAGLKFEPATLYAPENFDLSVLPVQKIVGDTSGYLSEKVDGFLYTPLKVSIKNCKTVNDKGMEMPIDGRPGCALPLGAVQSDGSSATYAVVEFTPQMSCNMIEVSHASVSDKTGKISINFAGGLSPRGSDGFVRLGVSKVWKFFRPFGAHGEELPPLGVAGEILVDTLPLKENEWGEYGGCNGQCELEPD